MVLNTLHTLSGVLILLFFFGKIMVHGYLDVKRGAMVNFTYLLISPSKYFLPYKAPVNERFVLLKRVCNLLLILAIFALLLNIVVGVGIYFNSRVGR